MKENAAAHASSKQIDQTNKHLHTSLRREMERAKQVSPITPTPMVAASFHSLAIYPGLIAYLMGVSVHVNCEKHGGVTPTEEVNMLMFK